MMLARDSESRHPFSPEPTREILSSLRESLVSHNDVDCYQQLHSCSHCRTSSLCTDSSSFSSKDRHRTCRPRQVLIPSHLQTNDELLGKTRRWCRRETTPHRVFFQNPAVGRQWNVFVTSPDERQNDQPTWVPILLSVCEAELEDVSGDERDQHQTCLGVNIAQYLRIGAGRSVWS